MSDLKVRGFTFWRPWAEAIVRPVPAGATAPCPKRVDNRSRPLPVAMNAHHFPGAWFAIHTGKRADRAGLEWINRHYGYRWGVADLEEPGRIIGVAQATGCISSGEMPWYFGPTRDRKPNFGWVLDNVFALPDPIPAQPKFALGLWKLPEPALAQVERFIRGVIA